MTTCHELATEDEQLLKNIELQEEDEDEFLTSVRLVFLQDPADCDDRMVDQNTTENNHSEDTKMEEKHTTENGWTESKCWEIAKFIPAVNTIYGVVRGTVLAVKGDKSESVRSFSRAVAGVAELGTGTAVILLTPALTPALLVGSAFMAVTSASFVGQTIGGGGEMIVDIVNDENFKKESADDTEERVYNRIMKDTAALGAVYSGVRSAVYYAKGKTEVSKDSIKNAGINLFSTSIGVAAGAGLSKLAVPSPVVAARSTSWSSRVWSKVCSPFRSTPVIPSKSSSTVLAEKIISTVTSPTSRCCTSSTTRVIISLTLDEFLDSDDAEDLPVKFRRFHECLQIIKRDCGKVNKHLKYTIVCVKRMALKLLRTCDEYIDFNDPEIQRIIIETGQVVLVQALIVCFGGSFLTREQAILTVAKSSLQIVQYLIDVINHPNGRIAKFPSESKYHKKYEYIPSPLRFHIPKDDCGRITGKRILCCDGGGIRGLVCIQMLEILESHMQKFDDKKTVRDGFDYLTGSSTGALIICSLGIHKSVKEAKSLYFELKSKVFCGHKPYDARKFEEILKSYFGELKMRDIEGIRVIVTATYGTVDNLKLQLYTNYDDTQDELIWKVLRRSCAAPSYFDPLIEDDKNLRYYDGGLVANNPTSAVLKKIGVEISQSRSLLVSLGTGIFPVGNDDLPLVRQGVMGKFKMIIGGELSKLIDAFVNQITKTDGDVVLDDIFKCELAHCRYYRCTPKLPEKVTLDETNDEKIINLLFHTMAYANEHGDTLLDIARLLSQVE